MLSREIETTLGGRFFAKHITPYAFGEYLTACGIPHDGPALLGTKTNGKIRAACAQYLQYGGLPESLLYKAKREYISGVYQKVLLGDIITRNSIRNDYAVKILSAVRFPIPSCKRPCAPSMFRWPRRRLPTTSAMRRMPICCSICRTTTQTSSRRRATRSFISPTTAL